MNETASEFFASRATWLKVEAVDRPTGGWDVVLRIDGTYYTDGGGKGRMIEYFQQWILSVLQTEGIEHRRLEDWRA